MLDSTVFKIVQLYHVHVNVSLHSASTVYSCRVSFCQINTPIHLSSRQRVQNLNIHSQFQTKRTNIPKIITIKWHTHIIARKSSQLHGTTTTNKIVSKSPHSHRHHQHLLSCFCSRSLSSSQRNFQKYNFSTAPAKDNKSE